MKQKTPLETQNAGSKCHTTCIACKSCKGVEFEEASHKIEGDSVQLYAREAESYFFHYALAIKKYN